MSASVCLHAERYENDDDRECCPAGADCIDHWKPAIEEDADEQRRDADGIEDQKELPITEEEIGMVHRDRTG